MVHFGRVCKDYCGIQGKEGEREELKAYAQARQPDKGHTSSGWLP